MRTTLFSPLSLLCSLSPHHHSCRRHFYNFIHSVPSCRTSLPHTLPLPKYTHKGVCQFMRRAVLSASVEQVVGVEENWDFQREGEAEAEAFRFDDFVSTDLRHLSSPSLEVKELEDLPEQWRRSTLARLCKELPSHNSGTSVRILKAQKKWMTQEDATYVTVHCLRIRENEVGFGVNLIF